MKTSASNTKRTSAGNDTDAIILDNNIIPIIPLKDIVVFPNMVLPLFIGRPKSIGAVNMASSTDNLVLLLSQKDTQSDDASIDNLYHIGTIAKILQVLKLPDGTNKILVESKTRARALNIIEHNNIFASFVEIAVTNFDIRKVESEAIKREILVEFDKYIKLHPKIPDEVATIIAKIDNLEQLCDVITTHIVTDVVLRQEFLEITSMKKRLNRLLSLLIREIEILTVERNIQGRVKQQIEKNQKEYYLHEQAKAIQQELGEEEDNDLELLHKKIKKAQMSVEAEHKALQELRKLKSIPSMSSESGIIRSYIEHLIDLPWKKSTKINKDLNKAQKILDNDHYGLEKIKERIIEFLAVERRVENNKSPILCFVGPPGVGKTSLAESIARATGRKYARIALGGLHDEGEIRGHRRTYIGAMPGKINYHIAKCKVNNPLILLDEIEKTSADHRGDPASALLEVLDPSQNHTFTDNYTDTPFDISKVMFVATANSLNLPHALRDRMEVIHLSGYTEYEKVNIAKTHLIAKQFKSTGLKAKECEFTDDAILTIIRHYTSEAGVRNLDRCINKICRKIVTLLDTGKITKKKIIITSDNLNTYLGVQMYEFGEKSIQNRIGRVNGLAWTESGGDILTIESVAVDGKGAIIRTGKLGDVMQESIQAAISFVRSHSDMLGIEGKFYENKDIHVHVPEGAIPKDGPSAGIAMVTAISSSLNKIPIKSSVAMTGEVTLYGEVLPIGGLKEKLLAALRSKIDTVIIPEKNLKDLEEIPDDIKSHLKIIGVKHVMQVLDIAFEYPIVPLNNMPDSIAKSYKKSRKQSVGTTFN